VNASIDVNVQVNIFGVIILLADASALMLRHVTPLNISVKIVAAVSASLLPVFLIISKISLLASVYVLRRIANSV
jgi:hypothetical protein